ncbi:DALR anticodon-binding domain-containing protein 3 [Orchesella cincta]|uniref:DALR anticodon-binding domain-containing protein 3 n=1 Tax=Orchesella cincta TaxID=48709 RepID=A0A1D2N875_ORCCI|nr:DALR anticodon-binding domain-containing protein 3 [Orchesella cincta]
MTPEDTSECRCDPLKIIVQGLLSETLNCRHGIDDSNNFYMFYRSSVARNKVRDKKLQFRILQETFKSAQEWVDEIRSNNGKSVSDDDENFERQLENVVKNTEREGGRLISNYALLAISPDPAGNIMVTLDPYQMTQAFVSWIITGSTSGSVKSDCHQMYPYNIEFGMRSTSKNGNSTQLLEYRKVLLAQTLSVVAKMIGHTVTDGYTYITDDKISENAMLVRASPIAKATDQFRYPEIVMQLSIGNISVTRNSETQINLNKVLNERLSAIKEISESRRLATLGTSSWTTSVQNLATATLHYDILSRPIEVEIQIPVLETQRMNHDALVIMYNYSRVLSILRRFDEQVQIGDYPNLPSVTDIDFKSICTKEEEIQLLQTIMEWPRIRDIVINFTRFEINVSIVAKFLLALAKAFNGFYFEIVVLVPTNAPHNFPGMMARIYLMKTICSIFENCFDILQINHSETPLLCDAHKL